MRMQNGGGSELRILLVLLVFICNLCAANILFVVSPQQKVPEWVPPECSEEKPCTFTSALKVASEGDTLLVQNGTYELYQQDIYISSITIQGSTPDDPPTFTCGGNSQRGTAFMFYNSQNVTLSNLQFIYCDIAVIFSNNMPSGYYSPRVSNVQGGEILIDSVHTLRCNRAFTFEDENLPHITIVNSNFENAGDDAPTASIAATSAKLSISSTAFTGGPAVYASFTYLVIHNCTFGDLELLISDETLCGLIRAEHSSLLAVSSSSFQQLTCYPPRNYTCDSAQCITSASGAAIYTANSSNIQIYDNNFTNNVALQGGSVMIVDPADNNTQINNCSFEGSRATDENGAGGGIYIYLSDGVDGPPTQVSISNSHFQTCTTRGDGGSVAGNAKMIQLNVENCNFTNNRASGNGGAIYHYAYYYDIVDYYHNVTFLTNWAGGNGGALFAPANVTNSTFIGNKALSVGGGFSCSNSILCELHNSYFSNNTALDKGGALGASSWALKIYNSTFYNNNATWSAGAAYLQYSKQQHESQNNGDIVILHSEFINNTAPTASALFASSSYTVLRDVNFVNNTATDPGSLVPIADFTARNIFTGYPDDCSLVYNSYLCGIVDMTVTHDGIVVAYPYSHCGDFTPANNETCEIFLGEIPKKSNHIALAIALAVVITFFVVSISLFIFYKLRLARNKDDNLGEDMKVLVENEHEGVYITGVAKGARIGAGAFGTVYEGKWNGAKVAIKTVTGNNFSELLKEAAVLRTLRHPNIVQFLGIYKAPKECFMVTEFISGGNLENMLRNNIGKLPPTDLIKIALEIAAGMRMLEHSGVIHRDLAARNILVDISKNGEYVVKVADFGMSRMTESYYTAAKNTLFPVKWASPEVILYNRFSSKSDVWAFGILLWEIASFGELPYHSMANKEASMWVLSGNRLTLPPSMSPRVAALAQKCWLTKAEDRPTFVDIFLELSEALVEVGGPVLLDSPRARTSGGKSYHYQQGLGDDFNSHQSNQSFMSDDESINPRYSEGTALLAISQDPEQSSDENLYCNALGGGGGAVVYTQMDDSSSEGGGGGGLTGGKAVVYSQLVDDSFINSELIKPKQQDKFVASVNPYEQIEMPESRYAINISQDGIL